MGSAESQPAQRPSQQAASRWYLQRVLCAYGDDVVLVVAQLTAPAAALTDPLDEARLVRALNRAIAAARAQQLPLQGERQREVRRRGEESRQTAEWARPRRSD